MANLSLIEQLDQALDAIIAHPDAPPPASGLELVPLLRIAAELRDLPHQEFRARLKKALAGKATVTGKAEPVAAATKTTATTYLCVSDAAAAIEFYKNAFGAIELMRITNAGEKIMHACIMIDGAPIMLADEFPELGFLSPQSLGGSAVKIHLDVANVDALAKQAISAGVREVRPLQDQFYGARSGQFADPFGYTWILSTRTEEVTFAEMQRRFDALQQQEDKSDRSRQAPALNPVREGFRTVTPYLTVADVHEEIAFIQKVFAAKGQVYGLGSAGGFHSEYNIGDSMLMIGGGGEGATWQGTPSPASLHVYVEDVDAVYERAVQAGATALHPPQDQVYGERSAAFRDVGGNEWYPATYKGPQYIPEGAQNLMPYLHPRGAAKQLDFLKQAFGAEEIVRGESPDGVIYHAQVRIGNSVVEMGEAHAEWQPMPMHFMLYVDNVDAWYARAVQTQGAVSLSEPADQPYGDRVGAVKDPFDNTWYLATHIRQIPSQDSKRETTTTVASSLRSTTMTDSPKLFRVMLEVADLDKAVAFYSKLLDLEGRVQRGSRAYFDCGPVILAILDPTPGGLEAKPNSADLYFAVRDIDQIYTRARELKCLSQEGVHGASGGEVVTRPWGERSFYVVDPWGNGLCFVDETTLFTGK